MATRFPLSTLASEMVSLRNAMDRLLSESFAPGTARGPWSGDVGQVTLPLDVYATDDAVVVLAAVPGMNPEDIRITLDKNTLTLAGEIANVAQSEEAKGATWYLHELPYGSFERSLTLPMALDTARAEATFENGMLRLTLPKAESEKPKQIRIRVGGAEAGEASTAQAGKR